MTEPAPDILSLHAAAAPDKLAVLDDRAGTASLSLTFGELNAAANRLAHVFRDAGAQPGSKVVWCGQNSIGVVIAAHAARKAGVVAVPLNYRLTPEEATYVVDNSDASVVWVDAEFAELFDTIRP